MIDPGTPPTPPPADPRPPEPAWSRAYELPSARRVVGAGLQLVVDATGPIRRASIYIGLLVLGALGPGVVVLLLAIGRLLAMPGFADALATDPTLLFYQHPEVVGPLLTVYVLVLVGFLVILAISIDAQAMAITILGGQASERPVRPWEAVVRARQVFWRLFGAGFLVGLANLVVSLAVTLPFIRPFDSNTGLSFIASMIGALAVTPFAFAGAGIVLGDVGATEALRRSVTLFRARPRIAFVVTLFTLVTSAIQTFALSAGADAAVRVGELLHLGLDQGTLALVLTVAIVLAFIVAFGSLTFTIAAIVAAPQVAGFLGLTHYTGGLDRALALESAPPRGFRWVSLPMIATMVGLLALGVLALPDVLAIGT